MGQKVTIGGDRLGSGKDMKAELHNYFRSTHNLTQKWTSSMAAGILYPCLIIPAMRGDKFIIDVDGDARTIPTKAPLFGSFKLQIDYFQCPARLYQAILHNNPTAIGLKMNQVYFPQIEISTFTKAKELEKSAFSNSCLMKYLGVSGLGNAKPGQGASANSPHNDYVKRYFNATPVLAYYDIFKNYYANKQEENAYVINGKTDYYGSEFYYVEDETNLDVVSNQPYTWATQILKTNIPPDQITFYISDGVDTLVSGKVSELLNIKLSNDVMLFEEIGYDGDFLNFRYNRIATNTSISFKFEEISTIEETLDLKPFKLSNIDDMRMAVLSHNNLGSPFIIDNTAQYPYLALTDTDDDETGDDVIKYTKNLHAHQGLVVKTYQSDLYNNWIRTEWIDGENGIAEITKIAVDDGAVKIDAINLAEKLYNMLNRVALSGNTYEDWQDAVYTQSPRRHIESPVYLGGASHEIVFEEIVQSSPADGDPLGTLAGKGRMLKRKGGHVVVKVDEASFIIGIVSITPRINYTQGNEWYMTELLTMDDVHKPALDGIGFQNLMEQQLNWLADTYDENGVVQDERRVVGKVPAWSNYSTAVDKAFGDFADLDGKSFMTLNRNYDISKGKSIGGRWYRGGNISDLTTYIDPRKYNYAFAVTTLDAQNFWVQLLQKITARRLMSAHQIPNV